LTWLLHKLSNCQRKTEYFNLFMPPCKLFTKHATHSQITNVEL
jgi:hypothetical protein